MAEWLSIRTLLAERAWGLAKIPDFTSGPGGQTHVLTCHQNPFLFPVCARLMGVQSTATALSFLKFRCTEGRGRVQTLSAAAACIRQQNGNLRTPQGL